MMNLTFGLFTRVSDSGPHCPLVKFRGGNGIARLPDVFSFADCKASEDLRIGRKPLRN